MTVMWKKNRSRKEKQEWWLRFYHPVERVLEFIDKFRPEQSREKELQQYRELYVGTDSEQQGKQEKIKQCVYAGVVVVITLVLALVVEIKTGASQTKIVDNRIGREDTTPLVELKWSAQGEKGTLAFALKPQRIASSEREEMFREAKNYITECIRGGNESLQAIQGDVIFPESVPGTEVTVQCQPESYHWLNADGSRTRHALPENGAKETLTVKMCYYEEEREFVLELLLLPEGTKEEQFQKKLESEVLFRVADNTKGELFLPDRIDGVEVNWEVKKEHKGMILFFLGLVLAACILLSGRRKQEELVRKREQELMADYPELVSKFLLLLHAGLSTRSAWERITEDYMKSGRKRYVYEEMLLSMREMENGRSEVRCYERFGKRCRLLPYMRFSGALVQNLQKGAKGALQLLEQEALAAFAERKDAAKRKGEEAGTKLLLPMFLLLGLVLVIVMLPAFWKL